MPLHFWDTSPFIVPDAEFAYDADQAQMKVSVVMFQVFLGDVRTPQGQTAQPILYLISKLVRKGSYIGTNGFGARVQISSSTYFVHGFTIPSGSFFPFSFKDDPENAKLTFSMEADEARALKPSLRLVLVGKLAEARVYERQRTDAPATFDVPIEIKSTGLYIPLLLEEVRIVDIRSGKPIRTFPQKGETIP